MLSRCVASQVKHNWYFLVGLALGLWLALAAVPLGEEHPPCVPAQGPAPQDEYAPRREQRPASGGAGGGGGVAGRSVQRPRYYSTELGMRAPLLAGVLTSEEALEALVPALNLTAGRLQPALRFFLSARAAAPAPAAARANVVGFTDAREMLKPFHALKYLADNYLDDYDFFFLVSDKAFVNARRLSKLVSRLSAARHLYMGAAQGDSPYCTLEGGILLSNSVLRAVHGELDWCVRNSYSPHHHENVGRCVLHAARVACTAHAQGESYVSVRLEAGGAPELRPALADAVSAHPVAAPEHLYAMHAYVSRVALSRSLGGAWRARRALRRSSRRHPPHFRNATWPAGLRSDPGLAPPPPASSALVRRFDHLRWTWFNATHAMTPDDHRAVAPLPEAHRSALQLVLRAALAWAERRWGTPRAELALVEGAWRWEPAAALRYRLLLRLPAKDPRHQVVRQVEVCRALGAARLVPVPYVTESARVTLLVPTTAGEAGDAVALLRRYEAALRAGANTALLVVEVHAERDAGDAWAELRQAAAALRGRVGAGAAEVAQARMAEGAAGEAGEGAARAALAAAGKRLPRDALVLLAHPRMEYNEDFLNRVRMNTLPGASWYWAGAFARFAQFAHPRFVDAAGRRPAAGTGRFAVHHHVLAFYRRDYDSAVSAWRGGAGGSVADVLAASPLRCVRAPEPGLVVPPPRAPCALPSRTPQTGACLQRHAAERFQRLELGARAALARLLLELRAEAAAPAPPAASA